MPPATSESLRVEHGSSYAVTDELSVPRRPPWAALGWVASGVLGVAVLCVLYVLYQPRDWNAWNRLPIDQRILILPFIFLTLAGIHWPTVWAWLTGPRTFTLGRTGFSMGLRAFSYQDIVCLRHDYSKHLTDIVLREGERIRLRWPIWEGHEQWTALLASQTAQRLLDDAWQKLKRGEELDFGKSLRLSLQAVTLKGRVTPVREIAFVNTLSGSEGGTDYRDLRIGTSAKTSEINLSGVSNPHVFFGLMQALVNGSQEHARP